MNCCCSNPICRQRGCQAQSQLANVYEQQSHNIAQTRIVTLEKERDALRAALEEIAATPNRDWVEDDVDDKIAMREIARKALGKQ